MSLLLALQDAGVVQDVPPNGGSAKKRKRISWPERTVDLYALFKIEQNNAAIIAALELT